jgi:hypothetical protein
MNCALCNEPIDQYDMDFGDVKELDDTFWHLECLEEYSDDDVEEHAVTD